MFERFTDRARRVVVLAQEEARGLDHPYIGTEHLVLGLIAEGEGVAGVVMRTFGATLNSAREHVLLMAGRGSGPIDALHIPFTPLAKKALESSLREALQLGHNFIGTEHILLGVIRADNDNAGCLVLRHYAEDLVIREAVITYLREAVATDG